MRMEDLDQTREVSGAAIEILRTLQTFGLIWDEPVIRQSERAPAYQSALDALAASGLTYPCGCSRAETARRGRLGIEGFIYPGTCRAGLANVRQVCSIRCRTHGQTISFTDRIQGRQRQSIDEVIGDFVLRRADGLHAYQLAVVVDDAWQQVTHVVRGADLLLSTPRQILLQQSLGLASPDYAHVPLILDTEGRKLSKSLAAAPVDPARPLPTLQRAWTLLGQEPLPTVTSVRSFWTQAIARWRIEQVPVCPSIRLAEQPSPCLQHPVSDRNTLSGGHHFHEFSGQDTCLQSLESG